MDGQGNLERTWKVREKSGNLKINGYGRHTSENLFTMFKRGKDVLSSVPDPRGGKRGTCPPKRPQGIPCPQKKKLIFDLMTPK